MAQAGKGTPRRTVRSNFFRVIQGTGVHIAASADNFAIQIFSEYPELVDEPPHATQGKLETSPAAIVREMEVNIILPLSVAAELGKALTMLGQEQGKEEAP